MPRLETIVERFPLAKAFTIARGSKTEAVVVTAVLRDGASMGRGECVPYARYGESVDSVLAQIDSVRTAVETPSCDASALAGLLPPGAARNALDCALIDLAAKRQGRSAAALLGLAPPLPLVTAYTLSLDSPDAMMAEAKLQADRPLLKIKLGGGDADADRLRAVRAGAPHSRIIVDANEGWTADTLAERIALCADCAVALIEQPLPAADDAALADRPKLVPICADESAHVAADIPRLAPLYDVVNVKLDKTGGLTEALAMVAAARAAGLGVMVGCMVGSSLGMAPAVLAAQGAEFVDLDGPLLLARDRPDGLIYHGSRLEPPAPALWG